MIKTAGDRAGQWVEGSEEECQLTHLASQVGFSPGQGPPWQALEEVFLASAGYKGIVNKCCPQGT